MIDILTPAHFDLNQEVHESAYCPELTSRDVCNVVATESKAEVTQTPPEDRH